MATSGSPLTLVQCCSHNCVIAFSLVEIQQAREKLHSKRQLEQDMYLVNKLQGFALHSYKFKGKTVCRAAFCWLYGIGHKRLGNLHLFITGARDATDYRCYSYSCESDKQKTVVEWITSHVIESHLCEPMVGKKDTY
ncbi:hypothetical protein Pelo_19481 [Pelomyxa schiedti]|nr:hypothetical protein Pelo_19481 [Pelomyxa schiedti]